MIYNVKYTKKEDDQIINEFTWEIDDNIFFDWQPENFQMIFREIQTANIGVFDNCSIMLLEATRRIVITEKTE
ncbi:MAG: hypothetical protein LBV43_05465 [Prevotella sp.]|jgi:hypothetical protein|nr:hypothetical protein [Prevotella sp.]